MSWPLATFAIVLGVLVAGWLAYERSRPSARMTAIVGTLAAVAALGRDAFVALPDVKPITAMTFVVGYALGPLPGFAVGSIGMLASNIVLGQGPYTPWQMAAWGLVGLLGALLGWASGRRMGRFGIALACGVSALGAKEIMNIYTWTIGASHTPAAFLATASVAVPYDITDTLASFLFGLAFGPELARLLGRMRARMDVRWEPVGATPLLLIALVLAGAWATVSPASPAHAMGAGGTPGGQPPRNVSAGSITTGFAHASVTRVDLSPEISYLERSQNRDGGFGGASDQRSSELYSAWAAMGLAAAGRAPLSITRAGHSVLDSIRGQASTLEGPGDEERTILALYASGVPLDSFPGGNPFAKLLSARSSDGSFGELVDTTTFAIFALRAGGRAASDPLVRAAGSWLARQQNPDGGFSFATRGAQEDVDDTAAALQGVIDAGERANPIVHRAVAYLLRSQNLDGGYAQQPGGASNAQSTAWAVQGLTAAGQDVGAVTRGGSRSPLAYLETLVAPDGSVRYSRTSAQTPVWVTAQALMALAGKPLPIAPVSLHVEARHASTSSPRADGKASPRADGKAVVLAPVAHHAHVSGVNHAQGAAKAKITGRPIAASPASMRDLPAPARERLDAIARMAGTLVGLLLAPVLR